MAFVLSGASDFVVNTDDFVVDTSTGYIGFGRTTPTHPVEIYNIVATDGNIKITSKDSSGNTNFLTIGSKSGSAGTTLDTTGSGSSTWNIRGGLVRVLQSVFRGNRVEYRKLCGNFYNNTYGEISSSTGALFLQAAAGNVGIATLVATHILSLGGNAARTFWMQRHTTANTAGNTLTVQAGGATSGATDKAGGNLRLKPGTRRGRRRVV